jgi:fibronectin type 3 domain-containing protein
MIKSIRRHFLRDQAMSKTEKFIAVALAAAAVWMMSYNANARDVSLAWDASEGAATYNVYRSEQVNNAWGGWLMVGNGQTALTYVDTTAPDSCAMWVVTAVNDSGAESAASNPATDCPIVAMPPGPPMNIKIQ